MEPGSLTTAAGWMVRRRAPGAALRQSLAAFIAIAATIKTSITKVILAGDDLAVLYTGWTITATGIPSSGKAVKVMRLQPDGTRKLSSTILLGETEGWSAGIGGQADFSRTCSSR